MSERTQVRQHKRMKHISRKEWHREGILKWNWVVVIRNQFVQLSVRETRFRLDMLGGTDYQ